MMDTYSSDMVIQSLDNSVTPPIYVDQRKVKGTMLTYTQADLLSGVIPENSHRVLILNRDLAGYEINLKSDRIIIHGKPYVPQAIDTLSRSSANAEYATEVRVVG